MLDHGCMSPWRTWEVARLLRLAHLKNEPVTVTWWRLNSPHLYTPPNRSYSSVILRKLRHLKKRRWTQALLALRSSITSRLFAKLHCIVCFISQELVQCTPTANQMHSCMHSRQSKAAFSCQEDFICKRGNRINFIVTNRTVRTKKNNLPLSYNQSINQ